MNAYKKVCHRISQAKLSGQASFLPMVIILCVPLCVFVLRKAKVATI